MRSDARLRDYLHIRSTWPEHTEKWLEDIEVWANAGSYQNSGQLRDLARAEEILLREGKIQSLAEVYEHRFYYHALWSQRDEAIKAAQAAYEIYVRIIGEEQAGEGAISVYRIRPEAFEGWGQVLHDKVSLLLSSSRPCPVHPLMCSGLPLRATIRTSKSIMAQKSGRNDRATKGLAEGLLRRPNLVQQGRVDEEDVVLYQ